MDPKSRKQLLARFAGLALGLPIPFVRYEKKSYYIFPSNYAFVHDANEDVKLFLTVYVDPKGESAFTLQFGWSVKGRYPEVLEMRFPQDTTANILRYAEDEYVERTRVFVGRDQWWPFEASRADVSEKSFTEIETLLHAKVVPYLQGFLRFRKVDQTAQPRHGEGPRARE